MWYVKKAASKVAKLSQQVLKEQTQIEKLIKDIISSRHEVVPTKKMNDLAALSFSMQNFEQIINAIDQRLKQIKFERKSLKKRLNVLILVSYLIKYGASGFIDEFRSMVDNFSRFENLQQRSQIDMNDRIKITINDLSQRVKYIKQLLFDKTALMRQKELARLIRQKLIIMGGDYTTLNHNKIDQPEKTGQKVQDFLEHYVWKYTKKIDCKLDEITDALIAKIDHYLDCEEPQNFQIEELNSNYQTITKTQFELSSKEVKQQQYLFVKQKLPVLSTQISLVNHDLLELQIQKSHDLLKIHRQSSKKEHDLIEIEEENNLDQKILPRLVVEQPEKIMDDLQIESFRKQLEQSSSHPDQLK